MYEIFFQVRFTALIHDAGNLVCKVVEAHNDAHDEEKFCHKHPVELITETIVPCFDFHGENVFQAVDEYHAVCLFVCLFACLSDCFVFLVLVFFLTFSYALVFLFLLV